MHIRMLFSHVRGKVYFRRYGRQTCVMIFHSHLIFRTQEPHLPFCIDKAHKRSFTEVALNSVLEEIQENAIDFAWEFILQIKTFTSSVFVVFPN